MTANATARRGVAGRSAIGSCWRPGCPMLTATMRRYLAQQAVTLSAGTITAADRALRIFGLWICDHDPSVVGVADINRGTY